MRYTLFGIGAAAWVLVALGCGTGGAPAAGDNGAGEVVANRPAVAEAPAVEDASPAIAEPDAGYGDAGPRVESDEQLAEIPSMPISQLLGKTRADIETLFHPAQDGHAMGWVRYNAHLEVRYEKGRCVELIQLVPGGKTCRAAARWVGFGDAMAPIYRAEKCVWPPDSLKHSLGRNLSGELIYEGGVFRAKLHRLPDTDLTMG